MSEIRIPPQNIEAEKAVLGSILIDNNIFNKVIEFLAPEFFYDPKHSILFEHMLSLNNKMSPIDIITLSTELKKNNKFKQVGGTVYLTELLGIMPTSASAANYAQLVRECAVRRQIISFGAEMDEVARNQQVEIEEIVDNLEKKVLSLSSDTSQRDFFDAGTLLELQMEKADQYAKDPNSLRGISSGLNKLDAILNGFHNSELIILAARPSVGKSALAFNFARHAAVHEKKSVLIFSLEMPAIQIIERVLAQEMKANLWNIRMGKMTADEHTRDAEARGKIAESNLYIDETPGLSIVQLRSKARKLMMEVGLDMIIIDYLQLMQTKETDNRAQAIGEISRSLKILARELAIPIICLSQLNRAVESRGDRVPQLSDLRESGSIEQDADLVMFISREATMEEMEDNHEAVNVDIHVAKHRNGPIGKCSFVFEPKQQRYIE